MLAYKLPDEIPMQLGVFCEPLSCLVRGWENMEPVRSDSSVLICGAGTLQKFRSKFNANNVFN